MRPGRRAPLTPKQDADAMGEIFSAIEILLPIAGLRVPERASMAPGLISFGIDQDCYNILAWYDWDAETVTYGWEIVNNTAHHLHEHFHTTAWTAVADMLLFIVKLRLGEEITKHQN